MTAASAWADAADGLSELFGDGPFELRFSLSGQSAVRALAPAGAVARRHAEPPDPAAPWSARARCGDATGWLLAARAPSDGDRARELLQRAVERHSAVVLQRLAAERAALDAALLERLTHRLRTDVSTLQAVAEGAVMGLFDGEELEQIPAELKEVGEEAQRRLSSAREVMAALEPEAPRTAEPLLDVLRDELEAAGVAVAIRTPDGEWPAASVPGGWTAAARLLAHALAHDARLGGDGATVAVSPHPDGWTVTAGAATGAGEPVPWDERTVGDLVNAGHIAVAAGGAATAEQGPGDRLRVAVTVPAAPSGSPAAG